MDDRESIKAAIRLLTALLKYRVKKMLGDEAVQILSDELMEQTQLALNTHLEGWFKEPGVRRQIKEAVVAAEDCFSLACQANDEKLAQWVKSLPLSGLPTLHASVAKLPKQIEEQELKDKLRFVMGRDWPGLSPGQVDWAVDQFLFCLRRALLPLDEFQPYLTGQAALRTDWTVRQLQQDWQAVKAHQEILEPGKTGPPGSLPSRPLPPTGKLARLARLPPGSQAPYPEQPFVGRRVELITLASLLLEEQSEPATEGVLEIIPPVILTGLGGIGKTQLAMQFCYRYGRYFPCVYWINCGPDGQGHAIAKEIAACGEKMDIGTGARLSRQVTLTLEAWRKQGPCLVVLDNLENPQVLKEWLPELAGMRLLVTARRSAWPKNLGAHILKIDPLSRGKSRQLLRKLASHLQDQPASQVDAVAFRLGDHPLALTLAGAYLNAWDIPLKVYLDRLEQQGPLQPLDENGALVSQTLQVQWDALADPGARRVLSAAAALGNLVSIHRSLLAGVLGLPAAQEPPSRLDQALKPLLDLSLLAKGTSLEIRMHPLVRAFVVLQEPPGGQAAFRQELLENLVRSLEDPNRGLQMSRVAGESLAALSGDKAGILPAARPDILKALLKFMQSGTSPIADRRQAALLLGRLEWRRDLPGLSPAETLEYLELASRYVYTRGQRAFLIESVITPCLAAEPDLLNNHQQAQLLAFRAAMQAQLSQFDLAREDYRAANQVLEELLATTGCLPIDELTSARVRLGFGRLAVEQAGQPAPTDLGQDSPDERALRGRPALERAKRYFEEALEAARRFGGDPILEANIYSELSWAEALLGEREPALQAYQTGLAVLSERATGLRAADPEAWVYCRARLLETAGMVRWQLAEDPQTCAGDPLAEYRAAYDLAGEEIQFLEAESLQISDVQAVAHFNAGDYLQAIAGFEPQDGAEQIKAARYHWQVALEIALKLGVEDVTEQTAVRLKETSPAAASPGG